MDDQINDTAAVSDEEKSTGTTAEEVKSAGSTAESVSPPAAGYNSSALDNRLMKKLCDIDVRYKTIVISALIWGLLAHGIGLFNKFTIHDEAVALFSVGTTLASGRWMLEILQTVYTALFCHLPFSLPLVNGLSSIVLIALATCLIVRLLGIRGRFSCIALTGIMVATPVIAGLFGYMYTAPYYMLAFVMTALGCNLIGKRKKVLRFAAGVLLITCAVGIYQAFYPVALTYLLFCFIKEIYDAEEVPAVCFLKKAGYYLLSAVCAIGLYFVINRIALALTDTEMVDYQNISSMGQMDAGTFFARFFSTFRIFVSPAANETANVYAPGDRILYYAFVAAVIVLAIVILVTVYRKNVRKGVMLTLLFLMIPCTVNGIFIMCEESTVHTLMVLNYVAVFVLFIWLIENVRIDRDIIDKAIAAVGVVIVLFFSVCYTVYDNIVYLYADIMQTQAVSYFTSMEAQIKSTPGYDDDYPVAFVNYPSRFDMSGADRSIDNYWLYNVFELVTVVPYEAYETELPTNILYDYDWLEFMILWTGYYPDIADPEAFEELPEVASMPSFPDDGSVRIIDDTVVVKF